MQHIQNGHVVPVAAQQQHPQISLALSGIISAITTLVTLIFLPWQAALTIGAGIFALTRIVSWLNGRTPQGAAPQPPTPVPGQQPPAIPQPPAPVAAILPAPVAAYPEPTLIAGDLLTRPVACIVNAANERCLGGQGIDGAIHTAAPGLLALCQALPADANGLRCRPGHVVVTGPAEFAARGMTHIMHAVGPRYRADAHVQCCGLLRDTYWNALLEAQRLGIRSIAFPSISTGIFAFPFDAAVRIARATIQQFMQQNPGAFDRVEMVFLAGSIARAQTALNLRGQR